MAEEKSWCPDCRRMVRTYDEREVRVYVEKGQIASRTITRCIWCKAEIHAVMNPYPRVIPFPGGRAPGGPKPPASSRRG